jgi:tRNA-dihydrouridine synthase
VDDEHRTYLESGRIAEDAGAAAVALHARTAHQLYSGTADWSAISELKAAVTTVPVLGNGDIWEATDALAMVAETGCDGVVVGRGCLGRPWLFRDLADAFAGRPPQRPPALGEVAATMRVHARLLCDLAGELGGCRDFRKHTSWYLTGFPVGGERRRLLALVATLDELDRLLDDVVGDLGPGRPFPLDAIRVPRGHTNGPRPVALPQGWFDDLDDPTPPVGAELLVSGG